MHHYGHDARGPVCGQACHWFPKSNKLYIFPIDGLAFPFYLYT